MNRTVTITITALVALTFAVKATAQLRVTKPAELTQPVALQPGQGAIVVGLRRPDKMSLGKSGTLAFARYDVDQRNTIYQPKDAKKNGDTTTYWVDVRTQDKKSGLETLVFPVSPGDYVLFGATPGPAAQVMNNFCLGAPTFRVNAGEVVYFGDITPYMSVKVLETGNAASDPVGNAASGALLGSAIAKSMVAGRASAMAYSSHPDDARQALASQPALAAAFKPAEIRNGATYACIAQTMTAYQVPGAPALPATAPATATGATN